MVKTYYSLLERIEGQWVIQFGDYSKAIVAQERRDMHDSHPCSKLEDLKIVSHPDTVTDALVIVGLAQ